MAFAIAREIREKKVPLLSSVSWTVLGLGLLVLAPIGVYLYEVYPDWSRMYLWAQDLKAIEGTRTALALAYAVLPLLGYSLTHRWILNGRERPARAVFVVLACILVAITLLGWDRLVHVGTAAQFRTRQASSLYGHPLAALLIALGAMFVTTFATVLRLARRSAGDRLGWEPVPPGEPIYTSVSTGSTPAAAPRADAGATPSRP